MLAGAAIKFQIMLPSSQLSRPSRNRTVPQRYRDDYYNASGQSASQPTVRNLVETVSSSESADESAVEENYTDDVDTADERTDDVDTADEREGGAWASRRILTGGMRK